MTLTIRPLLDPDTIWLITDTTDIINYNILVKPVKTIYLEENYSLSIRDYIIDIESKIEYLYGVYLPEEDYYKIGGWTDRKFYQYIKKKFPKALEEHDRRVQIGRKIAKKRKVKIMDVTTPDGGLYQEIKINVKNYTTKQLIDTITNIEDTFIEIYSKVEGIPKDKFKTQWTYYKYGWNKLLKIYHHLEEILKHIPPKATIKNLYLDNTSYLSSETIGIQIKITPTTSTEIYLEFTTPNKNNNIHIQITDPKNFNTIFKKLKNHNPNTYRKNLIQISKKGSPDHKLITITQKILNQIQETNNH